MNEFTLLSGPRGELEAVPHIKEFSLLRNNSISLNSFEPTTSENLRIFCVVNGKFDWVFNQRQKTLFPGDIAFICPGQNVGGAKGFLDIGTLFCLHIELEVNSPGVNFDLGSWSNISKFETRTICKTLFSKRISIMRIEEGVSILSKVYYEIMEKQIGYITRVNQLISSLFILIARQNVRFRDSSRGFPGVFLELDNTLRKNLAHNWTVQEMADLFGLGTTAFTERVKNFTGFSPINYLINIRVSEAIKLLKSSDLNFTNIALEIGFYSSQHFSTTFKKLTGYTPSEFRKQNTQIQTEKRQD